jgi:hypothetical protein
VTREAAIRQFRDRDPAHDTGAWAIDKKTLRRAAFECLDRIVLNRKVRLLGMRLGGRDPSGRTAR